MDEIVIIEDQPEIAYLYERALAPALITSLSDLPQAHEYLQNNCPQLIILDFYLPSGSGLLLLDYMRSQPALSAIPVIGISSDDTLEKSARAQGVAAFLIKPFNLSDLRSVAERLISNASIPQFAKHRG